MTRNRNLANSPERAARRAQAADLSLIKVINLLSRGTWVVGGRVGFVGAYCKRENLPLTRDNIRNAKQVYDSVTMLATL